MDYNEELARRVRIQIEERSKFAEKEMFGGICFLLQGNMACGILKDDLIVRVGPERYEESLVLPHVREFDVTGRSMKGWVMVSRDGQAEESDLSFWIEQGTAFALTLPPK